MTRGAAVHRVLARCLVDPAFLKSIEDHGSAALGDYDLDESAVRDFKLIVKQLTGYAGLITAVQNNGLWQHIPATRLLLKRHGLDLRTFVEFRAQHQANRAGKKLTRDALTETFFSFFEDLLTKDQAFALPQLRNVFLHERTIWAMHRKPSTSPPDYQSAAVAIAAGGVTINGDLQLIYYDFDPIAAVERISAGDTEFDDANATAIGYWRPPSAGTLQIIALTPAAADILQRVDGSMTLRALADLAGELHGANSAEVLAFLEQSVELGLISAPTAVSSRTESGA